MPDRCRALFAVFSVVLVGALLPAVAASGASRYGTKVLVSLKFPAYHGSLQSSKQGCLGGRTVKLYRKKAGAVKVLGTDTTSSKGRWSIPVGKRLTSGEYWAQATAHGSCKAGKSKVLTID
jgi:hypothetical protein